MAQLKDSIVAGDLRVTGNVYGNSLVYHGDEVGDSPVPLNADQLQGHAASYFATPGSFVNTTDKKSMTLSTSASSVSFTVTKSGYKPIAYSTYYNYSTQVKFCFESVTMEDGKFTASGFAATTSGSVSWNLSLIILWVKL